MPKRTVTLFPNETAALKALGQQLSDARRARRLPRVLVAQRANLSLTTLQSIEKGAPTVALGCYVAYTRALGLSSVWSTIFRDEAFTHDAAYNALPQRVRRPTRKSPAPGPAAAPPDLP